MSRSLQGTTVMLTGAGGALASAIAKELIDQGAELILVGRGEGLARAEERLPAKAVLSLDLADSRSTRELRKHPADILVHTVGAYGGQDAQKAKVSDLRAMFSANFDTLFNAVQGVLPHMLGEREGLILGVSAGQAARGSGPKAALYTASKAAVGAYLGSLHAELRDKGVYAATLYPMGALDTPANRQAMPKATDAQFIDVTELAQAVSFLLRRDDRGHLTELKVYPAKG